MEILECTNVIPSEKGVGELTRNTYRRFGRKPSWNYLRKFIGLQTDNSLSNMANGPQAALVNQAIEKTQTPHQYDFTICTWQGNNNYNYLIIIGCQTTNFPLDLLIKLTLVLTSAQWDCLDLLLVLQSTCTDKLWMGAQNWLVSPYPALIDIVDLHYLFWVDQYVAMSYNQQEELKNGEPLSILVRMTLALPCTTTPLSSL